MTLQQETISFFVFICVGIVCGIVFDFFRAIRKSRKPSKLMVKLQDIVYFFIVTLLLMMVIYIYMKDRLRVYLIIGLMLGVWLYLCTVSSRVVNIFYIIIKGYKEIMKFILIPFDILRQIFSKQVNIFKKIVNKCCKRISYVIDFTYKKILLYVRKRFVWQEKVHKKQERKKRLN